jgi:hypothetical protein
VAFFVALRLVSATGSAGTPVRTSPATTNSQYMVVALDR